MSRDRKEAEYMARTHCRALANTASKRYLQGLRNRVQMQNNTSAPSSSQGHSMQSYMDLTALHELQALREAFEEVARSEDGKVDAEGFVEVVKRANLLDKMHTEKNVRLLFKKIDAECRGELHWEELSNHVLSQQANKLDVGARSTQFLGYELSATSSLLRPIPPKDGTTHRLATPEKGGSTPRSMLSSGFSGNQLGTPRGSKGITPRSAPVTPRGKVNTPRGEKGDGSEPVTVRKPSNVHILLYIPLMEYYVGGCSDGYLYLLRAKDLSVSMCLKNGNSWITSIASLDMQPLAVAAMDRTLTFYDSSRSSVEPLAKITNLDTIPMAVEYIRTVECDCLVYGDDMGYLVLYRLQVPWGEDRVQNWSIETGNKWLTGMQMETLGRFHSDWVTNLQYMASYSAMLSSGMDGRLIMVDIERKRPIWTCVEHSKGVNDFDVCYSFNFIASCGIERDVMLWSPFNGRAVGRLKGHSASVRKIAVNDSDCLLYSLSADNCVKVWDIRNNSCLQTISIDENASHGLPTTLLFCSQNRELVTASTKLQSYTKRRQAYREDVPLATALVNTSLEEAIGVYRDGTTIVWSLIDGTPVFSFSQAMKADRLRCGSLDSTGRRLIVGSLNGWIGIWNYNNGDFLDELTGYGDHEITCIRAVSDGASRFICAGGWYGGLLLFDDPLFHPSSSKTPTRRTDANSSDFNALEHSKRNYTIVTGSSDGEICSWKCDLNSLAKVSINDSVHVEEEARSIECLTLWSATGVIVAASAGGVISVINAFNSTISGYIEKPCESTPTCLTFCPKGKKLFVACEDGGIRRYDLNGEATVENVTYATFVGMWIAHDGTIVSLETLEGLTLSPNLQDDLLLTAASDGRADLWTLDAKHIGTFGQSDPWSLDNEATWTSDEPVLHKKGACGESGEQEEKGSEDANVQSEQWGREASQKKPLTNEKEEELRLKQMKLNVLERVNSKERRIKGEMVGTKDRTLSTKPVEPLGEYQPQPLERKRDRQS